MFSSGNIAPDYFGGYAFFNRIACDYYFFDCLVAGDFVHYVQHNLFQNRAKSPRAGFERNGFFATAESALSSNTRSTPSSFSIF